MADIQKAKQQIQQARQTIAQQRQQANVTESQLEQAKSKLPNNRSQRYLRGQLGAKGLQGMEQRRKISRVKEEIGGRIKSVKDYIKELGDYEKDVQSYETQVKSYESQVAEAQRKQADYDYGYKLGLSGKIDPSFTKLQKKGYQDALSGVEAFEYRKQIQDITGMPTSRFYGLSQEEINKLPESQKLSLEKIGAVKTIDTSKMDRGTKVEFKQFDTLVEDMKTPSRDIIPLVSAAQPSINRFAVVDVPQTFKERFVKRAKDSGYISAIVKTPFEEIGKKVYEFEIKKASKDKSYELYQPQATKRAISILPPTAAYFSQIGPALITAESIEELSTKRGRERIEQKSISLQEKGFGKTTSKVVAYGEPIIFGTLGALGIKTQARNIRTTRELKAFEKTPTEVTGVRLEGKKGGVDILVGTKDVGKVRYVTQIKQPFYKVGDSRVVMESGKGVSARIKGGRIELSFFESGGRSQKVKTIPRQTTTQKGFKYSRELSGEGDVSRVITKEYAKGKGVYGIDLFGRNVVRLKVKQVGKIKESGTFLSVSKEEEGIIKAVGGDIKKLEVNILTGEKRVIGKPSEKSIILKKKIDFGEIEGSSLLFGSGKKSSPQYFKQLYETQLKGFEQPLIYKGSEKVKPFISKSNLGKGTKDILSSKSEVKVEQMTSQKIKVEQRKQLDSTKVNTTTGVKFDLGEREILRTKQKTKSVFKPKQETKQLNILTTKQPTRQKETPLSRTALRSMLKTGQQKRTAQESILKTQTKTTKKSPPKKPVKPKFVLPPTPPKERKKGIGIFEAIGFRFGKQVKLGKGTKEKAERVLEKFLTKTLGASGIISKEGKAVETSLLDKSGFRPSKISPLKVVEQKQRRLKRGTKEVPEIQSFRRKGKRKNLFRI